VGSVWRVASERLSTVPQQRDPEVGGHLSGVRGDPAGVRHAAADGEAATECGLPLAGLTVWEIVWPGDRRAIVCTACAIAVVRATDTD
jgi:hypothetical protein